MKTEEAFEFINLTKSVKGKERDRDALKSAVQTKALFKGHFES